MGVQLRILGCIVATAGLWSTSLIAAESADPDWPCIQGLVPQLSAAQMWDGPEPKSDLFADDRDISRLASTLASRRTPLKDIDGLVETASEKMPVEDRDSRLTALFGQSLAIINADRASLIAGIRRFARKQRRLAERIQETTQKLKSESLEAYKVNDLKEALLWDQRIFTDREKSLIYLCEQPVLLEQRAFAFARSISFFLSE